MRQARSLFRHCFRLSEATAENHKFEAESGADERLLSTTVLNALPTHPHRVSSSLRVFVQRIAHLAQPKPVPRKPRTRRVAQITVPGWLITVISIPVVVLTKCAYH